MSMKFAYKNDHPYDKRSAEAQRIREKYPDRIPVICEKDPRSDIPPVDKRKCVQTLFFLQLQSNP